MPAPADLRAFPLEWNGRRYVVLSFPIPRPAVPSSLSAAETEVAELMLLGLSNAQIAERRRTSPHTVANQVAAIFRKLGVQSRAELVARLAVGDLR